MNITREQILAAEQGEPVRIQTPDAELVVLRADLYDKLTNQNTSPRETYASVLQALDQDDDNPDQYLEYLDETR